MPFSKHSMLCRDPVSFLSFFFWLPSAFVFQKLTDLCSAKPAHLVHHTLVRSPSIIVQRSYPSSISNDVPFFDGDCQACLQTSTTTTTLALYACMRALALHLHTHKLAILLCGFACAPIWEPSFLSQLLFTCFLSSIGCM